VSAAVSIEAKTGDTPATAKHHLRVITTSELREARACMRRHRYRYVMRRRPREVAEPLTFGTLTHDGHEAWRRATGDASDRYAAAVDAVRAKAAKNDAVSEHMLVTVEELLLGYAARWADDGLTCVAAEERFEMPLVNPDTGHASRTFLIGGKFDTIVKSATGRLHVEELKTTSSDIEAGSLYWEKIRALDTQVSIYINGAHAAGYPVDDCIYTVIRKPGMKPLKATPEESRKWTKPTKADPTPRLYANQREHDESPEEWRERLRADIGENPGRYYQRATIVRLEHDEREHAFDMWSSSKMLHEAERSGYAPRNPDACSQFGGCAYLAVCTGSASIDDDAVFRTADAAHEELATVE
jgi:hypothetical protein